MSKTRKSLLLLGVLASLIVGCFFPVIAVFCLANNFFSHPEDKKWVLGMALGYGFYLARMLPSLLVPYAIFFWWKPGRVFRSLISALTCGVLYTFLQILLMYVMMFSVKVPNFVFEFDRWAFYAAFALIPGIILALLGTYLGKGIDAVPSKSVPNIPKDEEGLHPS